MKIILKNITKTTKYFSQDMIGDSDEELSSSDSEDITYFTPERPLRLKEVTLQAIRNDDITAYSAIKGDFLVHTCHTNSQKAVKKALEISSINFHTFSETHVEIKEVSIDEYNEVIKKVNDGVIPDGYQLGQLIQSVDEKSIYYLSQISYNGQNNKYIMQALQLKLDHSLEKLEFGFVFDEKHKIGESIQIPINTMIEKIDGYEPAPILEIRLCLSQGKLSTGLF